MGADGRNEEEAPDNATTDDEDDHTCTETTCKCHAAAHPASVDDTADAEPDDSNSELEDDTTEHNHQDLNSHKEGSHDADSNTSFDEISNHNPEDELGPWVDFIARATRKVDDLIAASGNTSWIIRVYWKQTRMIAKHYDDRQTKLIFSWKPNNVKQSKKGARNKEDWPRDGKTTSTSTYKQPDPTYTTTIFRATRFDSQRLHKQQT